MGNFYIKSFENNEDLEILKKFNVDNSKKRNFKLLYRKPFLGKYQYKIKCIKKYFYSKDRGKLWVKDTLNDLINITGDELESDNHKFSKQSFNMSKLSDEWLRRITLPQRSFVFYLNDETNINMFLMTLDNDTTDYVIEIAMEN